MERYAEYKDSGVDWIGKIPEGWETTAARHIFQLHSGKTLPDNLYAEDGAFPVYGGGNVRGRTNFFNVHDQTVIVSRQGATCGTTRLIQGKAWITEHALIAYFLSSDFHKRYFAYVLQAMNLGQLSMTAAQPGISASLVQSQHIPIPGYSEQRAIAEYLNKKTGAIDAAVKDIERSIESLNEYRQSVISEAVTKGLDPNAPMKDSSIDWIGQIPETWNGLRMKAILNRIEQGWSPSAALSIDENNGWHVLTLSAVKHGSFIADAVKPIDMNFAIPANLELSDGDLLMTRANTKELVGDVCLVDDCPPHVIPSDLIYRLTLNRSLALPRFIMYALLSNMVRRQISAAAKGSSGTMPKISHNIIKQLQLCLPPLSEQQSIINHLDNATAGIDSLIQQKQSLVVRLKEYRTSLISECVTGKVKVPGVEE
ncbi:restriction endonuclease subunit S [Bifidobacterium stellenboschense]|uniref:Type I restriction-modification system, S subunit n=1 Tax=Bifidobacterium stellenboschense TaxID=762211 RepID=A0A087D974_9BIFI|nr:restriction endonuclease subunit S [Bifidobacterium stellenboschense]KFI92074.1 Type I restriction-modification system, S subunit [Bifidobacterium stellenboschense]